MPCSTETIGHFRLAFSHGVSLAGARELLDGLGTTLHHTSAAWLIVAITTRIFKPATRPILSCTLPLIGQHVGVLCAAAARLVAL